MPIFIVNLLTFIGSILVSLLKHPIFKKMAFFSIFFSLVTFIIDYFLGTVKNNLNLDAFELAYYMGIPQAIQVFVGFAIATFVANHLLTYFKNF